MPESYFFILPPIFIAIVFSILGYILWRSYRKLPAEEGLTPLFSVRTAGRINGLSYTFPFVRFAIYDDFIVIACASVIRIERKSLTGLKPGRWLRKNMLKIIYTERYERSVEIYIDNQKKVIEILGADLLREN